MPDKIKSNKHLLDRELMCRERLRRLREDVAVGLAQADAGKVAPLDMKALKAKVRARRKARR